MTVKSGTDAIYLALKACDIKEGDEVITSTMTAIPTISAIISTGAKPRLIDINLENGLIDQNKIENFINKNTKAIIPVHLYGSSCEIVKICKIAKKHNLKVMRTVHNHLEQNIKINLQVLLEILDVFHFIQRKF